MTDRLIDVNVNLSHWPTRRVRGDETADLVAKLKAHGVVEAWAGSFAGLLHKDVGHLGIFVSGRVAKKEHAQIVSVLKSIELLPPGLYGMQIEEVKRDGGVEYEVRFEEKRLEDITARLNPTKRGDERAFEAVSAISDFNQRAYELFLQPLLQATMDNSTAELLRTLHPLRAQRWAISDLNPWLWWLTPAAAAVSSDAQDLQSGGPRGPELDLLSRLTALVDANLVQRVAAHAADEPRFRLLETVRDFALAELTSCGEATEAHRRQAQYYLKLAEQTVPKLQGKEHAACLSLLEGEHDNLHINVVGGRAILVVLFDERSSLGLVRLRVKKATGEIAGILEDVVARAQSDRGGSSAFSPFAEITDDDIDALFN